MTFYVDILTDNLEGVAQFVARMVTHNGTINIEQLYVVDFNGEKVKVRKGRADDKKSDYSLVTGGEVVNSFLPLYEVGYFFSSLFLAGIGTAVLHKNWLKKYKHSNSKKVLEVIKADLISLTEDEIFAGIRKPVIGIVSCMDTDVIPIRYNKHQLWKIDPKALIKRVAEITSIQYGNHAATYINTQYWTVQDQQIADIAMSSTTSLQHAKAVQTVLVYQIILKDLGINIKDIPIYFNYVPKEEIVSNGPGNSLLEVLINLHTPEERVKYRKITGIDKAWILTKACPKCGQGDKRILSSKLMGDGVTVKVNCRPHEFIFKNEHGDALVMKGCGYKFSFKVPIKTDDLYNLFKNEDFSIHFAARELLPILRDSIVNPIGFVATDLGVVRSSEGKLVRDPNQVPGYGDNLDMLISALGLQYFFCKGKIANRSAKRLKKLQLIMPNPVMLFAYDKPTQLVDPDVSILNQIGVKTSVSDTSALKARERGETSIEMLKKAVNIHAFSLKELFELRGKKLGLIERKLLSGSVSNHSTVSGRVDQIKSNNFLELT
jgi:hypothetical protein